MHGCLLVCVRACVYVCIPFFLFYFRKLRFFGHLFKCWVKNFATYFVANLIGYGSVSQPFLIHGILLEEKRLAAPILLLRGTLEANYC